MAEFYDLEGQEVSYEKWSEIFKSRDRFLARDVVPGSGLEVSTVWIGLEWLLEVDEGKAPLIFETMVFEFDDETYHDLGCWRWATREAALNGHRKIVDDIRSGELVFSPSDYRTDDD